MHDSPDDAIEQHETRLRRELAPVIASAWKLAEQKTDAQQIIEELLPLITVHAREEQDYTQLKAVVETQMWAAARLEFVLGAIFTRIETLEAEQAQRERFSDRWWIKRRQ